MWIRRLTWALIVVTPAAGCYVPGGGWTLRTGVDLRTHRKPGCYLEMVDTRWDEWNRVAQMNACCAPPAGTGYGPMVVESSVYGPGVPTPLPTGAVPPPADAGGNPVPPAPGGMTPPPVLNDSSAATPSAGPVSAPSMVPAMPPGIAPSEPSGSPASPELTPPAPAVPEQNQPVARTGPEGSSRNRIITDRKIARTLREIPSGEEGAAERRATVADSQTTAVDSSMVTPRTKRPREILFDTPLDPERGAGERNEGRVDSPVAPRANAAARRSSRTPSASTSPWQDNDNQVRLQGVITDGTTSRDRSTAASGEGAATVSDASQPSSAGNGSAADSPAARTRSSWRTGFGLFGR